MVLRLVMSLGSSTLFSTSFQFNSVYNTNLINLVGGCVADDKMGFITWRSG